MFCRGFKRDAVKKNHSDTIFSSTGLRGILRETIVANPISPIEYYYVVTLPRRGKSKTVFEHYIPPTTCRHESESLANQRSYDFGRFLKKDTFVDYYFLLLITRAYTFDVRGHALNRSRYYRGNP